MSYQNDLNRMGSIGGSACFCSGRCRQLGYCPNQQPLPLPSWVRTGYLPPPHDGKGYTLHTPHGREMTAADIGLPIAQWDGVWLVEMYGWPQRLPEPAPEPIAMDFVLGRWTNAPYAFWLGAEG
jgi:hypothetical protein